MRHAVLLATLVLAGAAMAEEPPIPKLMKDAPANEGKWKMELLQLPGSDKAPPPNTNGMMVCATAGKAMAHDTNGSKKNDCQFKLVEDGASRAVMEVTCPTEGKASRTTITKVAAKTYEISSQNLKKPDEKPMRARMSYVGPCSANDSVMSYEKDSPVCQKMRAHLPEMEKGRADCANAGANRAMCEQAIDRQLAQVKSMCGQ